MFRGMRGDIIEVMTEHPNLTAAETRALLLERFEYDVPESTIHAQINSLFHLGITTDCDTPDRECSITHRYKKTWRLVQPGELVSSEALG